MAFSVTLVYYIPVAIFVQFVNCEYKMPSGFWNIF